jgi:uncharacterized surface anchored protein
MIRSARATISSPLRGALCGAPLKIAACFKEGGQMFPSRIRTLIVCGAALFILGTVRLPAQEAGGSIQGTVRNASGDAMPGATVTVINRQTSTRRVLVTGANGVFAITGLPPGPYAVTAPTCLISIRSALVWLNSGLTVLPD